MEAAFVDATPRLSREGRLERERVTPSGSTVYKVCSLNTDPPYPLGICITRSGRWAFWLAMSGKPPPWIRTIAMQGRIASRILQHGQGSRHHQQNGRV